MSEYFDRECESMHAVPTSHHSSRIGAGSIMPHAEVFGGKWVIAANVGVNALKAYLASVFL